MNEVLSYFLESVVSMGLFWLFYRFVIEKENMLNFGRFYLLSTSGFSLVFPLVSVRLPESMFSVNQVTDEFMIILNQVTVRGEHAAQGILLPSIPSLITWFYLSGVVFMAGILIVKLSNLFRFIHRQKKAREGKYVLLSGDGDSHSFSLFHYIFIGNLNELAEHDRLRILEHEKVHVDQKHSYDLLFFEILSVIFWFNPFVWLYKNLVADVHEYLADKAVINRTGVDGYPGLLVRQAIGLSTLLPVSYFKNSSILKRIKKMKTYNLKSNKTIIGLFIPIVLLVFFIISCGDSDQQSNLKKADDQDGAMFDNSDAIEMEIYKSMPVPQDGFESFIKELSAEIKYPAEARNNNISGKVLIEFVVKKDGTLDDFKVLEGIGYGCDEEALRALKLSKKWVPGENNEGQPVDARLTLPVTFSLEAFK